MRADTYFGMAVSNIIAYFIMLDTGALLHTHGATQIETATQAAEALRPVGGEFAFLLFAIGIIGTGLLAVPVLAGSVGYALAELASWPRGLAKKLAKRPRLLWIDRRGNASRADPRICLVSARSRLYSGAR